eukprot:12573831-Alexandrium_andersonii.AAC.1
MDRRPNEPPQEGTQRTEFPDISSCISSQLGGSLAADPLNKLFTSEEVQEIIRRVKTGRQGGPDE